jgi:probable phosphoglycerate mutase
LSRARQYCEIIYNGQIIFDDRLVELNCGKFEGMEETVEMWKQFMQAIQTGDKCTEKMSDFIHRNCEFCDDIMREHKGKNVLIVTHAANTRVINYYFNDKPKDYDFMKRVVDSGRFIKLEN